MAKLWYLSIAISCWCFFCSNSVNSLHNDTDKLALMSFKDSIQQDPFEVLSSWNDSLHFCYWHGVSCSRRHRFRVVALSLNSQGLVGTLSPHLGNLSFLKYIDFKNNSFHGQIPQEIGRLFRLQYLRLSNNSFGGAIPANLSHCSRLEYLDLINNKLVGSIPAELGSLQKLESLGLAKNSLTGSIPASLGNLSSVYELTLLTNGFQGQIPEEFSQLPNLRLLSFAENNLSGQIPDGFYNISTLEAIELDFNQFNGSIHSDIGLAFPKLRSLILAYNKFTGKIPLLLSNASLLEQIAFVSNSLSGTIPKDLGMQLPNLRYVDFSYNKLEGDLSFINSLTNCSNLEVVAATTNFIRGSLPKSIANLSENMWALVLSENQLHDTIPLGFENLYNLRFLQLHSNQLRGPININFNKFQKLEELTLQMNEFTGIIPSSIGNLTYLSNLILGFNNLHGSIPPSLSRCHNLIGLDLSHNNLNGSIPPEVVSISSLSTSFSLAANALTGPLPEDVGLLQNLVELDLSDNRLSGTVPSSVGKCLGLERLRLKGNSFEGEIPQGFSALKGLQELDISHNNFSGRIPNSLAQLVGLNCLNLSFNQLQGEVPKSGIFLNASAVSLIGNNNLCGGIPKLKLPSCLLPDAKKNNLSFALKILIPVVAFAGICLVFFLVCFLIFCQKKRIPMKRHVSMPSFEHQFLRISYEELFKATNGFSESNIMGVGSYGSVYKGILGLEGIEVAVKVLNLQQRGASNSFLSECEALKNVRHRNLLKLLSACSSVDFKGNDFKALIYAFMANGSLYKWLHTDFVDNDVQRRESGILNVNDRLSIATDIAIAIEYLHNGCSLTIIHGDLKPSNILLDDEMTAHIGDFGLAKIVSTISGGGQSHQTSSSAIKGSIGYVAPEYGMGDIVSAEADIYSYGILLLEMFTGRGPTHDSFKDDLNLHNFVKRSLPDRVMDIVDPNIILLEDGRGSFQDCIFTILTIGVACSMELPAERMKMGNVIKQLQKIKSAYVRRDACESGNDC